MMIGNREAETYLTIYLPDIIGELDQESHDYHERFASRILYLIKKDIGERPKYHKGRRVYDYWTCGNCGSMISGGVNANYCDSCGFSILWDLPRCLTGIEKNEVMRGDEQQ